MNGGIKGVPNTSKSGLWALNDVFLNNKNIRYTDVEYALLHRWPLITNAVDIVGGLTLTNNGTVTFSNNGASFNGTNQWLSGLVSRPTAWSMTTWITPVDFSARRCPGMAINSAGDGDAAWGLWFTKHKTLTTMSVHAADSDSTNYIDVPNELSTTNYPTNKKTLCVATYCNTTLKVYRNSILLQTVTGITPAIGSTDFSIGKMGANSEGLMYGTIADFRIYAAELTEYNVATLSAAGPNPT